MTWNAVPKTPSFLWCSGPYQDTFSFFCCVRVLGKPGLTSALNSYEIALEVEHYITETFTVARNSHRFQ